MEKEAPPAWQRFIGIVKENLRIISIVTVIVIIVWGGVLWNRRKQASRRHKAAEALRRAVAFFYAARQSDNADFNEAIASLSNVIETYPGTTLANQAHLYLGHIFYAQGRYAASIEKYRKAAATLSSDSPFLEVALLDVAYALEAQREYSQARAAYQKVLSLESGVLKDRAVVGIGRCYEQEGNMESAMQTYRSMLERFPSSPWANELRQRLDMLQAGNKKG